MEEPAKPSRELEVASEVGRILREARQQQGFSQRALAKRMGHSHSSLSAWEHGNAVAHEYVVKEYELHLGLRHQSLLQQITNALGQDWDDSFSRSGARSRMADFTTIGRSFWESDIFRLYSSVLYDVTYEEPGNFTEVTKYIYEIAEDDQDLVVEEHVTTVPRNEPLRWRHFDPGARVGSGSIGSFEELRLQAWCAEPGRIEVLPLAVTAQRVKLVAFFLPPIASRTITWYVKYAWPGLWNPLRAHGQDDGRIGFRPFTTRAEIILVPPRAEVLLELTRRDPQGDVVDIPWTSGERSVIALRWSVDNPQGHSHFTVAARER